MMNTNMLTVWGTALCLGGATLLAGCDRQTSQTQAASASPTQQASDSATSENDKATAKPNQSPQAASAMGVKAFMESKDQPEGSVTVKGVVSSVATEKQRVALIDRQEFKQCNGVSCARLRLPVQWTGEMPKLKQKVRVTGRVQQQADGKIFVARTLSAASTEKP